MNEPITKPLPDICYKSARYGQQSRAGFCTEKMKILLKITEDKSIKLSLFSGKKEIDSLEWKDENSLSRFLLVNLDKLLRKNKLGLDKISGYTIISEVPQKWTTYRIADMTLRTLKLAGVAKK